MKSIKPDAMCDGGDLDCGSGLLLIIKKHMDPLEDGKILEVRSTDRTVKDDLPAWCRMVEHEFLGSQETDTYTRYFIKKAGAAQADDLEEDLEAAKGYEWTVRGRMGEGLIAKIHSRNHTITAGQPADFGQQVDAPSAVDYLIASLNACLIVGFKSIASRKNVIIDEMELTLKAKLNNVLYHLGIEDEGNPSVEQIHGSFYVSSPNDEDEIEEVWRLTLERSPVYQTLIKSTEIKIRFSIVY